jgi:Na+(H+)/acetate symporter ActP
MHLDPYILAFSALTVAATIWMGFWAARKSKTAQDFFVAGRSVSVGWNASAISGEYLSAASFMGIAGMVMSTGYDALWYPVCYACGYLFLLLFIAGPLRRFGAYTIPDFAEGRFDSAVFRKIAVVFVLFIGFFYTMPQMKGAGTTLAYIFPGLPYWAGVVLVGAVITLNVALGGMKGITLVQAFQYWAKMFAISVPVFVLLTVYGHYGKQLAAVGAKAQIGASEVSRKPLPAKAPADDIWINPFGPLTTKAAKTAAAALANRAEFTGQVPLRANLSPDQKMTAHVSETNVSQALAMYAELTGRVQLPRNGSAAERLDDFVGHRLSRWHWISRSGGAGIQYHADGLSSAAETKERLELLFRQNGILVVPEGSKYFWSLPAPEISTADPNGPGRAEWKARVASTLQKNWLQAHERPLALLYTYSLIIALVCGTAGLPHILVRFYTNPDGVAAKRTTMWVMILIGVFYMFPPIFGVLGRNLLPELYSGVGAKGTDKIVLELPRILNERYAPLGSVLSGITCAGAFAAFMSTFSGLLVSMTGALAHDVYGRMLKPNSTPDQRMRAFKICAVIVGAVAILLGMQVEQFQINFMVGQAFAIAAASYFPLLFMSAWWRGMTMKGAATGMLAGGLLALTGISLTSFSDLKLLPLESFWAGHPLARILCEQPAIWAVPLAIILMVVVSKLTKKEVPADIRMKMLVLHAPEQLGLKQEYIQEHQAH